MNDFPCQMRVINLPETVVCGRTYLIEAQVDILCPDLTLGFVMLHVLATGEVLRFAKKSTDRYTLSYEVPAFAQPGSYDIHIYATDERGIPGAVQSFSVQVVLP